MTTYYVSISALPLGDAVTIGLLQPPLTALLAWLVLGEVFGWRGAAGCTACVAGVVIVAQPPFLFDGSEVWSVLRAVGVGVGVLSTVLGAGELMLWCALYVVATSCAACAVAGWGAAAGLLLACRCWLAKPLVADMQCGSCQHCAPPAPVLRNPRSKQGQ